MVQGMLYTHIRCVKSNASPSHTYTVAHALDAAAANGRNVLNAPQHQANIALLTRHCDSTTGQVATTWRTTQLEIKCKPQDPGLPAALAWLSVAHHNCCHA